MALQLGLVGLPNVGKSTLFNALTRAGAAVASYPFTTISPNVGIVPVPDARLERVAEIVQPERVVPATLRVVDIAGLVRGASKGEGLGNQFLGHIRDVDAIAMVVRCFHDADIPHVTPYLDPVEDIETVGLELILSDLEIMERHLERTQTRAKGHPKEYADEIATIEKVMDGLRAGQPVRAMELSAAERDYLRDVALLTIKPQLLVANVSEDQLPDGGECADRVRAKAAEDGAHVIALCAALEAELVDFSAEEAEAYLAELGVTTGRGLDRFIWAGYQLLDYVTFFTTTGGKEVRAWTLRRGQTALDAAGTVHSDMARGFIRAEVVGYNDLDAAGSFARARELGTLRLEGREYVVQDGDVIHIRFAV
ncbi:MAG: redox-regulated ATPase YchF [Chloroflexi bacterium]|jgi:GTP-binding protein YchF|nr:redox-regulated ATPase YchF [Chloroflexota bacterium]